jgi:hypothetical protein
MYSGINLTDVSPKRLEIDIISTTRTSDCIEGSGLFSEG